MTQIKIFVGLDEGLLEERVNKWLEDSKGVALIESLRTTSRMIETSADEEIVIVITYRT